MTNGPQIPDYELIRRIGGGAYGEVWLARSATGAARAVKIVYRRTFEEDRPYDREFEGIQRFEDISREHASQLALLHVGRNDIAGFFFYVMELADNRLASNPSTALSGKVRAAPPKPSETDKDCPEAQPEAYEAHTLRADLAEGRLPATRVLEIALALTEALAHLHSHGLVHRDIKPSNIIFVNGRPKLADIGLVTDASDSCSIVGTEGYLPPEGPGAPQADVFALGKVLYEAVTGLDRREFPKLPEDLRNWLDAAQVFELNEIILKACASGAQRYQSAEEMRAELAMLERGRSLKRKRSRQRRGALCRKAVLALAVLCVMAASVWALTRYGASSHRAAHAPGTTNIDAVVLWDNGMAILRADDFSRFKLAYTNFHRAAELDSRFVAPYVGLLELLVRETVPDLKSDPQELRRVAAKLKALQPDLAATRCANSVMHWMDMEYPQAQREALTAIKADRDYELGHTWYGFMLTHWGWPAAGRRELEKSLEIKPSKVTIYRCLAQTYFMERDYTNAITWYKKALFLEPHHAVAYDEMGWAQWMMHDYTNSLNNLEAAEGFYGTDASATREKYARLRRALNEGGERGFWEEKWREAEQNQNGDYYENAVIQISLGHTNTAMEWLEKTFKAHERDSRLNYLLFDPWWDDLRRQNDPSFKKLLEQIGFNKVKPS